MKNNVNIVLFGVVLLSFFFSDAAAQVEPTPEEYVTIRSISVHGLERTELSVVHRELLFEEGETVSVEDVDESIQRLRNMGLFRQADYVLIPVPEGGIQDRSIEIAVDERWTLLPIFTIRFGGSLFSLIAGGFDSNVLGRYLELGGSYQRLGSTNSFVAWAHDPRFLNERILAGMDLAYTNRLRFTFDQKGEVEGAHLRFRRQLRVFASGELDRWVNLGTAVSLQSDQFSYDLVPDEYIQIQQAAGGLPGSTRAVVLTASARVGRIDADSYVYEGVRFFQSVSHSDLAWGANIQFTQMDSELKGFLALPWKGNFGARFGFGATSSDEIEQKYFVGGFGTLRGFSDSRFHGKYRWYSNAEYRIPSFDFPWFVLQHIAFVDAAGVTDHPSDISNVDGSSAGLGLRLIIPKIYRFVARIDYAWSIHGNATSPLSFGAQQFF